MSCSCACKTEPKSIPSAHITIAVVQIGVLAAVLEDYGLIDAEGSWFPASAFQTFYTFVGTVLGLIISFRYACQRLDNNLH